MYARPPRSRNEALASLMRRFRICEERGSGMSLMELLKWRLFDGWLHVMVHVQQDDGTVESARDLPEPRLSRCSSSPSDLPSRPVAGRTAGCASTVPQSPGLIRITGRQATRLYCELGRRTGNRSSGELPDPCGALSALAESPERYLILPIL